MRIKKYMFLVYIYRFLTYTNLSLNEYKATFRILPSFLSSFTTRRLAFSGAALPSVARTELLYLAYLALLYLRSWFGLLALVCFAGLRRLHSACSLAELASVIQTMLGLLDLRRLRLARSRLASHVRWFAYTTLGWWSLLTLVFEWILGNLYEKRQIPMKRFTFSMIFRKSSYLRGFWNFFRRSQNWPNF